MKRLKIRWVTRYIKRLQDHIKEDPRSFRIYSILRIAVIVTLIRSIITQSYESTAICILSLGLFLMPSLLETTFRIQIPTLFEIMIYIFIFAAEILGEINNFYIGIPGWDTMLHTINGFLCAAIGFSMVDLVNRRSENIELSPFYLAMVAFCFSMTIGVIWEFIEFSADMLFALDMQKDFIVNSIGSVTLDPTNSQIPYQIKDITETIIVTKDGTQYIVDGGYLDIGIIDTMKDLLVNFLGAIVFSVIGYLYIKDREQPDEKKKLRNRIARSLMIRTK